MHDGKYCPSKWDFRMLIKWQQDRKEQKAFIAGQKAEWYSRVCYVSVCRRLLCVCAKNKKNWNDDDKYTTTYTL